MSAAIDFIKYWHRLANLDASSNLLRNAYQENLVNKNAWYQSVKNLLDKINLDLTNAAKLARNSVTNKLLTYLRDDFKVGWETELFNDTRKGNFGNKLRCYRTFKTAHKPEAYLFECKNANNRKYFARFRLSAHKLHIETGRYASGSERLSPEDRICKYCDTGQCEDEFHFLMKCDLYSIPRQELLNKITNVYPASSSLNDTDKFKFIMSNTNTDIIKCTGKFVSDCFNTRNERVPS
jgi:hypothetical protein